MAQVKQKCDFCDNQAIYDAKTLMGPWAFVCERCFDMQCHHTEGLYKRLAPPVLPVKICLHCGVEKLVTEFYAYTDHSGVRRLRSECKECNLAARKQQKTIRKEDNNGKLR